MPTSPRTKSAQTAANPAIKPAFNEDLAPGNQGFVSIPKESFSFEFIKKFIIQVSR